MPRNGSSSSASATPSRCGTYSMSRISLKRLIDFEHELYRPEKPREIPHSLYPAGFLSALSEISNYSGRVLADKWTAITMGLTQPIRLSFLRAKFTREGLRLTVLCLTIAGFLQP